ncbi:MAG: assembly factor cbp4 [Chrysothrix sp. TS-e1954]|nr:MAG: assembly factor cbp4 [Chrysothrix sp. TS-e1954]
MVGGPALLFYISPTEEEIFKRYNPELQKRSLEGRDQRLADHQAFVDKMIEYSKDKRHIWTVWKEADMKEAKKKQREQRAAKKEKKSIADEIRRQRLEGDDAERN